MSDTPTPEVVPAPSLRARLSRFRRPGSIVGLSILGLVTLYLTVMTLLWWTHTSSLQSQATSLRDDLLASQEEMASTTEALDTARDALDSELDRGIGLANNKAQGEDYTLIYADVAVAMSECATEMGEVVKVTYNRGVYVAWTVRRYENDVAGYCAEVAAAVSEIDADLEEALQ